jgi:hypothetical protein
MKPLTIAFILIASVHNLNAQTNNAAAPKTPDPQFLNQVYYYPGDSLIALEKTNAYLKSKMKGFGGAETSYTMDGASCPIRIKAGDNQQFVVRLGMSMADPSMMIKLYKFDSRKGKRESTISNKRGSNDGGNEGIAFNIKKSGSDVYIMIPAVNLTPGEYGFLNVMMMNGNPMNAAYTSFAFGID